MGRGTRLNLLVWGSALLLAAGVFAACGGGSSHPRAAAPTAPPTTEVPDVVVTAKSFKNVNLMTRVGNHFVDSLNGHLAETLAVARKGTGQYPIGSVVQIAPQEAMVKHRESFSPATNGSEFFSLAISAQGTKILDRGGEQVLNFFHQSCANCHEAAAPQYDFICGHTHGCAPLPVGDAFFAALQRADPRPRH